MGLPLGWTLSHASLDAIRRHAASIGRCGAIMPREGYLASGVGLDWLRTHGNEIMMDAITIGYDEAVAKRARAEGDRQIRPDELDVLKKPGCALTQIQQILAGSILANE